MDIKKVQELLKQNEEKLNFDAIDDQDDDFNFLEDLNEVSFKDDQYDHIQKEFGIDLKDLERHFENFAPKKQVNFVRENEDTVIPNYVYETDSGFDLHSTEDVTLEPFERKLVSTGLRIDIPENHELQIRPKSGLALKLGLTVLNTPGTVDEGYNGEIKVILFNVSNQSIQITKGMKIAQGVFCAVTSGKWVEFVEKKEIKSKDRNDSGFGSTGI